jgi:putative ABC transport system permease protein
MISIILFVAFNALMLYTSTTQRMAVKAMNFDLIVDLDYRQSHASDFAAQVSRLPEVQRVAYRRSTYEAYVPPRAVLTDEAYRALQEMNGPNAVERRPFQFLEDGNVQFVLEVSAVGPAEFARYAAQLGLDVQRYSDPSAPLAILVNHTNLREGGKLYDLDMFTLQPGDTMTVYPTSGWTSPQTGAEAPDGLTWTVGAVTSETPLSLLGVTLVPKLIVSDAVLDGLRDRLLQVGPINPGAMYIQSDDPDAALEAIRRLYAATVGGNFSYQSMKEFNRSSSLKTLLMNLFFYGFLALITLVGVANMINTLDTNIKLRRREIAMLRSVGLTPGGLLRMLWYESLCYGLAALLFGLPIGIAVCVFIFEQFDGVSAFAFTLPWGAILACIVGILAIVFATMMISGAMIRNDNIVDTIKDENL